MKDIDFDELDRAVNSMASSVTSNNSVTDNNTENKINTGNYLSKSMDGISPKPGLNVDGILSKSPSEPSVNQRSMSLASRRSSGRFMDMVRTSIPQRPTVSIQDSPSVQQPQLQKQVQTASPNPSSLPTPTKLTRPTDNELAVTTTSTAINKPVAEEKTTSKWTNPLSFGTGQRNETSNNTPVAPKEERTSIFSSSFIKRVTAQNSNELPDSPFLADAKVDKRPLGAFSGGPQIASSVPPVQSQIVAPSVNPVVVSSDINSVSGNQPLPDELNNDLLKIESTSTNHSAQAEVQPAVVPAPTPVAVNSTTQSAMTPASQPNNQVDSAPDGQQDAASIYDTSDYHKTISHPAKQNSGWTWIVWILALLVIGAVIGAVVYFFLV